MQLVQKLSFVQYNNFLNNLLDAIFLNLFVTGIFTIVYSFPIYKAIPKEYYRISNPKLLKSLCDFFQIESFRKILLATIWGKNQNKKYFFRGFRNNFREFEINSMKAEFGHTFGFVILMILGIYIGINNSLLIGIMIIVINIIFNFYPSLLQRYHRLRINRLKVIGN